MTICSINFLVLQIFHHEILNNLSLKREMTPSFKRRPWFSTLMFFVDLFHSVYSHEWQIFFSFFWQMLFLFLPNPMHMLCLSIYGHHHIYRALYYLTFDWGNVFSSWTYKSQQTHPLSAPLILTAEQEPPRFLKVTFLISICWVTLTPASTHFWRWSCHHTFHGNLIIWNLAFASVFLTGSKRFTSKTGLFSSRNFSSLCPHLPKGSDTTQKYGHPGISERLATRRWPTNPQWQAFTV